MRYLLRICPKCDKYTMKDVCSICNDKTIMAHPPKFSPDDKYARYRIANKYDASC